ncbi:MAG: hypothetical protein R3C31_12320 [Hyphomonadaceae bacterium]
MIIANSEGPGADMSLASARDTSRVLDARVLTLESAAWRVQLDDEEPGSVYFLATHRGFGEDGTLQSYMEDKGMRHSHSPSVASRLMTNKHETKLLYAELGIPTPSWTWLGRFFGEPSDVHRWICKSLSNGTGRQPLSSSAPTLNDPNVISERFVFGDQEVSVWTLGADAITLPPLLHRRPAEERGKLAPLEEDVTPRIGNLCTALAQLFHLSVNARGIIRTDFVVDEHAKVFAIGTVAHPSLTRDSGAARQAVKAGLSYETLIRQIASDPI